MRWKRPCDRPQGGQSVPPDPGILGGMSQASDSPADTDQSTISSRILNQLVATVERAGVAREDFLRNARVEPAWLETPDQRMKQAEVIRIAESAMELSNDPALGLHCGQRSWEGTFDVISHLLAHASSFRDAFDSLFRFSELVTEDLPLQLVETGEEAELHHRDRDDLPLAVRRMIAEWATVGLYRLVKHFDGTTPVSGIRRVCFRHPAPEHHAEYCRVFHGMACFEQPFTGLVLSRSLLDAPSPWRDEELCSTLSGLAARRLSRWRNNAPYSLRVRELLVERRAPHRVGMQEAAKELGISVRSLHRRLSEEGRTFTELSHEASGHVAKQLLLDRRLTIKEAAHEMGFSTASAFHRAFRRWTGTRPGMLQRNH